MTSLIRCFCPLYVVKMAILSAGYPRRRMYMKIATAYSASPRFYKNKQDKKWRNCFSNTGFTDFRVRFITISQIGILLSHSKTDMTYAEGGSFGSYLTPGSLGTWSEAFLYPGSQKSVYMIKFNTSITYLTMLLIVAATLKPQTWMKGWTSRQEQNHYTTLAGPLARHCIFQDSFSGAPSKETSFS